MEPSRALLLAVCGRKFGGRTPAEETEELAQLAAAAGLDGLAMQTVRLRETHPATFFGAGAVGKTGELAEKVCAEFVVVNRDLSAMQARNLESAWGLPVLDRSGLILDIFARRARTHESKMQVELARCERHLSRLAGLWTHLERQRGGIGVRGGPGEKQIEVDRRQTGDKIRRLRKRIRLMQKRGENARARRRKNGVFSVALAGYTNAGKSTLFNLLTRAGSPANGRLFDTLELKSRRMHSGENGRAGAEGGDGYNGGECLVLSDTVGFIRDLPHELVSGFAATLRDAAESDLLLIVADAADAEWRGQLTVVNATLERIGAGGVPRLLAMNKSDRIGGGTVARAERENDDITENDDIIGAVWISAKTGEGVDELRKRLWLQLRRARSAAKKPAPATTVTTETTKTTETTTAQ